mmetsp:Transcript_29391/g.75781  ORF Transcript_29391/g.75781 Transcript_29391/m.75781 type:complete len:223 (-) Transcript_29391:503-1171(-)
MRDIIEYSCGCSSGLLARAPSEEPWLSLKEAVDATASAGSNGAACSDGGGGGVGRACAPKTGCFRLPSRIRSRAAWVVAAACGRAHARVAAPSSHAPAECHLSAGTLPLVFCRGDDGGKRGPSAASRARTSGHAGLATKASIACTSSTASSAYASVNLAAIGPRSHCNIATTFTAMELSSMASHSPPLLPSDTAPMADVPTGCNAIARKRSPRTAFGSGTGH